MESDIRIARLVDLLRSAVAEQKKLPNWPEQPTLPQLQDWLDYWDPGPTIDALRNASELFSTIGLAGDATRLSECHCHILNKWFDEVYERATIMSADEAIERDRILIILGSVIAAAKHCERLIRFLAPAPLTPAKTKRRARITPDEFSRLEQQAIKFLKSHPGATRDRLAEHLSVAQGTISRLTAWKSHPSRTSNGNACRGTKLRRRIGLGVADEILAVSHIEDQNAEQTELDRLIDEQNADQCSCYVD